MSDFDAIIDALNRLAATPGSPLSEPVTLSGLPGAGHVANTVDLHQCREAARYLRECQSNAENIRKLAEAWRMMTDDDKRFAVLRSQQDSPVALDIRNRFARFFAAAIRLAENNQ